MLESQITDKSKKGVGFLSLKALHGCDKESDNSKENTNDSLKQQQKTETSSVKVDKDWKEKWLVSDDEDEVEPNLWLKESKLLLPTATKKSLLYLKNLLGGSAGLVNTVRHQELTSPEQTAPGKDFSNPLIVDSLLKTIWSAEVTTADNGEVKITATIDGHSMTITEASLRRHLKLDDQDDKLTFQKVAFSPQWRFLIHSILHCISPKKTAWEQFSSNIATTVICLATNRRYNFSRKIFEHMVTNISSPHKFLMYPRFIQICLDMQRNQLQQHTRTYPVPSLSMKVFNNMKRPTKGYSGQEVALFPTMLIVPEPSISPSRITSSPSHSPEPLPSPEPSFEPSPKHTIAAPTQPSPTQPSTRAEHHLPTPHDSPLHVVHSHRSDEGSLKLNELMNLVTTLSDRIGVLEDDLKKTKKTYSSAYTKLILRVKKLESQIKTEKARRKARVVLSDDEVIEDDSSKQGRKLSDEEVQEKASTETELFIQEVTPTEVIQDQGS
ncbi:hypothetical protein Tco_0929600, partial [Tanacetum coccineum]